MESSQPSTRTKSELLVLLLGLLADPMIAPQFPILKALVDKYLLVVLISVAENDALVGVRGEGGSHCPGRYPSMLTYCERFWYVCYMTEQPTAASRSGIVPPSVMVKKRNSRRKEI